MKKKTKTMISKNWIPIAVFFLTTVACTAILFQSTSSTAAIGLLFIPFVAGIPTAFALLAVKYKQAWIRWLCAGLILFCWGKVYESYALQKEKQSQAAQDREQARLAAEKMTKDLIFLISQHPGDEEKIIDQMFNENPSREKILVLLQSKYCPAQRFMEYAVNKDMGFKLSIAQNDVAPSEALALIFNSSEHLSFYYSSLARNPQTPVAILRKLYELRAQNSLIVPNLANNPSTPEDLKKLLQ